MQNDIKKINLLNQIIEYSNLEYDWDGYGGSAPSADIVDTAIKFIEILVIFPLPYTMVANDEIGFYWEKKDLYIEISIFKKNQYSYYIRKGTLISGESNIPIYFIPEFLFEIIYETA